ncbi:MAG: exosortase K [Clostridia bacterium]
MNVKVSNHLFYCFVALIGILLTYWFKTAQDDVWELLLYPHARAVEIFYNTPMNYVNGIGYYSIDAVFAIGRECMGYNFIVMMFGMNACMFAKYFKGLHKISWLFISFVGAILIGILISCIRIVGSVPFVTHEKFTLIHSGVGIAFYFFALASTYAIIKNLVGRKNLEDNC